MASRGGHPGTGMRCRSSAVTLPWQCHGIAMALPWHCYEVPQCKIHFTQLPAQGVVLQPSSVRTLILGAVIITWSLKLKQANKARPIKLRDIWKPENKET